MSLRDFQINKYFKHKLLVRFFLLSIIFSFVIFFIVTAINLGVYQFDSFSSLKNIFILKTFLSLFLSLFFGTLISAFIVFLYGKKYLIEQYEKLEEADSRLELALEASGVGTWFWDLKTNVITWDDYIFNVYGARKEDFNNDFASFEKFILEEDREPLKLKIQECLENNTYLDSEFRIRRVDTGEIRYIGVKGGFLVNDSGEVESMTGVNFDVTKLKELNKELLKSNKSLEEFVYFVSHDLQEPIRTVSNYVELLMKYLSKNIDLDENSLKYSGYVTESAKRMRNMIRDILTYSKVGSVGEYQDIDLSEIVEDIKMNFNTKIQETSTEISYKNLPIIKARKFEIMQLFQNLISNSIKFTPEDRKPIIEIDCVTNDANHSFTLKDNGIGLKDEDFDRIFEVFQRVHNEFEDGTGLGLSICKKVVGAYGGSINLRSEFGSWTEFSFTLSPKDLDS